MSTPLDSTQPRLLLEMDPYGDPTPDSVYLAICESLVAAGAGDLEIYQAFSAVQGVFTRVYEMQRRLVCQSARP